MRKVKAALLIALILLISTLVPAQAQATGPVYIVQDGDTLYNIALRFNLSTDELQQANALIDPDALSIGDRLVIPGLEGISGVLTSQVVPYGENLDSLTRLYQLDPEIIIRLNHITSPVEVYAGANLILPQPEEESPAVSRAAKTGELTLVELSALRGSDPWTTLRANRITHSWQIMTGQTIFFPALGDEAETSGINPALQSVMVKGMPLEQGRTISFEIVSSEPVTLSGSWNGTELHFFSSEPNLYDALQGVHAMLPPGLYPLAIRGTFGDGSSFNYEQLVAVQKNYNFIGNRGDAPEKLSVDQSGLDPSLNDPENELVRTLVSAANPSKKWDGVFTVPGYNREWLTSRFGNRRNYNNDPTVFFHTGIDFEGGTGLPVKAAAPGVVVFAGPLTVRGNATFIDHGWGVYTAYFHQSEIKVRVGDQVEAGQEIGLVGATGLRVTGAHLHWEVWVNGVQVDPLDWLDINFP